MSFLQGTRAGRGAVQVSRSLCLASQQAWQVLKARLHRLADMDPEFGLGPRSGLALDAPPDEVVTGDPGPSHGACTLRGQALTSSTHADPLSLSAPQIRAACQHFVIATTGGRPALPGPAASPLFGPPRRAHMLQAQPSRC